MHLISKCTKYVLSYVLLLWLFHLFTVLFIANVSFQVGSSFVFIPVYMKLVHVAWIKIHIQCKSFSLNVKNKFEKVVESGAGDVEGERPWCSSSFIA